MSMSAHPSTEYLNHQLGEVIEEYPSINLAILYGSVAHGTARPDSDIDLAVAVDARTPVPYDTLVDISLKAGRVAGREAQVRDLANANGIFLKQVLTTGTVIFQRDSVVRAELTIRMLDFVEDMLPYVRMIRATARERFIAGS